jgi:DNA-binding GntR family transcriptional regulator
MANFIESVFAPLGVTNTAVYELIRDAIVSGRLAANERLVVADLAERHNTSTNPVREALQQLRGGRLRRRLTQPRARAFARSTRISFATSTTSRC